MVSYYPLYYCKCFTGVILEVVEVLLVKPLSIPRHIAGAFDVNCITIMYDL